MKKTRRDILIVLAAAIVIIGVVALLMLLPQTHKNDGFVTHEAFDDAHSISLGFSKTIDKSVAQDLSNYVVFEEDEPDIQMQPQSALLSPDAQTLHLRFAETLNPDLPHILKINNLDAAGSVTTIRLAQSQWVWLFSILISALLINNFVFTKYLGLCVFFGTSKRKNTATGMGVVFTIVMLVSAMMSWAINEYVLVPYHLEFLQIVVFIGLVSLTVQAVDTILRKVNPVLFNAFGIFLVLVIANCIIIAVPLFMVSSQYGFWETFMLALGAGGGFLLALYLMSAVRERLELAQIPESFQGLPIAFILAGQFALAFLGFSGLQF
ncbi:MAG: Rnf-Nqr domain containing protein [Bradymonadales bacterium]|jgi:electron transport complex protein RnfA